MPVFDHLAAPLRRTGTRARLTAAIALIVIAALAATFVTVYRGTGSDLRDQIDRDLSEDASALAQHLGAARGPSAAAVSRQAQRYINSQSSFGPSSELFVVAIDGAPTATNDPELLGVGREPGESPSERTAETGERRRILAAPEGYSTVELADAGQVRLLTRQVSTGHREAARISVGEPLESVEAAQSGVSRTFLLAGSLALVAALAAGAIVAGRNTRPMRRMARDAAVVDAGELSKRMTSEGPAETRRLAESFNHMLDRLEEAFARQRGFVADASHELRTPLTAIRGQVEVLSRSEHAAPEEIAATTAVVTREIDRMERMVEDMLLLAQMDEGIAHDAKPMEAAALLAEAVAGFAGRADRHLALGEVPAGTVVADGDRITQVIRNLLRNAIEHTSPGGSIRVAAAADDGSLRVSVADDGPGIPRAERQRVFARFYRAERSRDRATGGTGLGLAIARAIVEAHGGRIWADDAPAGGARVSFELPGFRPPA